MDAEQLQQALIERGFFEAAAMVAADVEAQQALEDDEERDDEVIRVNFGRSDDYPEAA